MISLGYVLLAVHIIENPYEPPQQTDSIVMFELGPQSSLLRTYPDGSGVAIKVFAMGTSKARQLTGNLTRHSVPYCIFIHKSIFLTK
jgi:hypothetical protein